MRYRPYAEVTGTPHVVVDGSAQAGTVLTLSHWPGSATPPELRADLSAEIALRYLETPSAHVDAPFVTNNHYDEDGVMGVWALTAPDDALARRALVVDVASAGDFGTFLQRDAFRVATAISAIGSYEAALDALPALLDDPGKWRALWAAEDDALAASEAAIAGGDVTIDEVPALDLAVFTVPEGLAPLHPVALTNGTERLRLLTVTGRRYEVSFRYETWVQLVSRPVLRRPDLTPLAERLSESEPTGRWEFDGVSSVTPSLRLTGAAESTIPPERFRSEVEAFLASAPPAWDPFATR